MNGPKPSRNAPRPSIVAPKAEGSVKVAKHAIQADVAATVVDVEHETTRLFAELAKDGMTAAELAEFQIQMNGMTAGMEMLTAAQKAYHDAGMSIIRNLA